MRVLGLDISKEGVAGVEMETAFGRFEIRETHEISISPDAAPNTNTTALAPQIIEKLAHLPDRTITGIPVELGTFRNLKVATKDKKAIKAALEFELEDDLPFEKENLHYDSSLVSSGPEGSLVHVAVTQKEPFGIFLKQLNDVGIDPDVVTTDAWAYRSLLSRIKDLPDPVLLIGIEPTKTFFYIHSKNCPILYREIPFGLKTIETKLKEALSPGQEELKTWIKDIGVTGINENVSNVIADALESLVPEIKQTELASRSQMKSAIEHIYVTGEGALLPGILNWLEEATSRPVAIFKPLSLLSPPSVSYSDVTEVRFARALALAFVTMPGDKLRPLDLRKGTFSKTVNNENSLLELIKKPLPYILITALVFFAAKTIEYKYYNSKLSDVEETLKKSVKAYFNGISDNVIRTHLADPEKLKKQVEGDLAKEREMAKLYSPNLNSPFDVLKTLSQKIGKDVVLDMVNFEAGADNTDKYTENKPLKTSLTFIISNPQGLSKLTEILERTFNLKKGNSEEVTQEGRKVYRVTFTGVLGGK